MPKEIYTIELDRPEEVTVTQMKNYISAAVSAWGGQYHPDDPLFGGVDVKVKRMKEPTS